MLERHEIRRVQTHIRTARRYTQTETVTADKIYYQPPKRKTPPYLPVLGHFADRHFADSYFADRHFADRTFADKHFADRHFAGGHFADSTFRRQTIRRQRLFR